uniref:YfgM family protein n=1 Tax=Ningiella ruwaisensis TaxID=2364274 RepID=UPI00109FA1D7|nr:tetratricopeptide repeat protein [Ningiella ruwaisensis]
MERYETEEQQIEAIKRFWKENGMVIILGAVIGLGGLWGWRWYNDSVISAKEEASKAYQASVEQFAESESTDALIAFVEENKDTAYAKLASLIAAQQAVEAEDFEQAKSHLSLAADGSSEVADVAKLRLAKVQLQLEEYDSAISTLESVNASAFADQVQELKGDIYYIQGKYEQAQSAYNQALVELPGDQSIQMKLDNIAYAKTQSVSSDSEE